MLGSCVLCRCIVMAFHTQGPLFNHDFPGKPKFTRYIASPEPKSCPIFFKLRTEVGMCIIYLHVKFCVEGWRIKREMCGVQRNGKVQRTGKFLYQIAYLTKFRRSRYRHLPIVSRFLIDATSVPSAAHRLGHRPPSIPSSSLSPHERDNNDDASEAVLLYSSNTTLAISIRRAETWLVQLLLLVRSDPPCSLVHGC